MKTLVNEVTFTDVYRALFAKALKVATNRVSIEGSFDEGFYVYLQDAEDRFTTITVFGFSLSEMPGCCGICIVHDFCADDLVFDYAKFGPMLNNFLADCAKLARYSYVLLTNIKESHLESCIEAGWEIHSEFESKSTHNKIFIAGKPL